MRLIDADDLAAKIMMEAPDFMDSGSSITKAFILAMVKTRSVTPTINAVQAILCKDCKYFNDYFVECEKNNHTHGATWYCADGERREE